GITSISMVIGSVQPGEFFQVFASDAKGELGDPLFGPDGTDWPNSITLPPTAHRWISIQAAQNGDVLLDSLTIETSTSPVPEPTSAILAFAGIALCSGWTWRRSRARAV